MRTGDTVKTGNKLEAVGADPHVRPSDKGHVIDVKRPEVGRLTTVFSIDKRVNSLHNVRTIIL